MSSKKCGCPDTTQKTEKEKEEEGTADEETSLCNIARVKIFGNECFEFVKNNISEDFQLKMQILATHAGKCKKK